MREQAVASFSNAAAPQAPARRAATPLTYNSHRRARPRLGDRRVYRPARRHTLSRIDETPQALRPRSQSLQRSADFSSTRPILRSRSNISADTSRSVPVCNQSHEVGNQNGCHSPQYAEPKGYDSASSYDRPASMSDPPVALPVVPVDPVDPAAGYIAYPDYPFYEDGPARWWKRNKRFRRASAKHTNLYLAFMY